MLNMKYDIYYMYAIHVYLVRDTSKYVINRAYGS